MEKLAFKLSELSKAAGVGPTGLYQEIEAGRLKAKKRGLQRDNYDGRLPTIKLAKSGSRRVASRELPV